MAAVHESMRGGAEAEDIVYALHDFDAENVDELSFAAGEAIVVLERDDQYGDGWFQGRNKAGEIGLFPQSYTSPSPPTDSPELSPTTNGAHTPDAVLDANMHDVQRALDQLKVDRDGRTDGASIRSQNSRDDRHSDDEGTGPVANPRAVLAAKAAENAKKAAQDEKDRAEQRRKDDEAAYARQRADDGLVEGLQLSDESDEEDNYQPLMGSTTAPPVAPELAPAPLSPDKPATEEMEVLAVPEVKELAPGAEPTLPGSMPMESGDSNRSRANTVASAYAESTYSASPPPPVPSILATSPPPATLPPATTSSTAREKAEEATPGPSPQATTPNGQTNQTSPFESAAVVAGAVGAGVAGLAAGAAATLGLSKSDDEGLDSPTKGAEQPMSSLASASYASSNLAASTPRNVSPSPAPLQLSSPPNGTSVARSVTPQQTVAPTPPVAAPVAKSAVSPLADFHDSPAPSLTSATHSRSSSRLGTAPLTAASNGTGETSPRDSAFGVPGVGTSKTLPFDPRTWGVEEVVEWARIKGFDQLTLAKFQEHEISGDVLLEMDVAMLKEIDLTAFGRRVHIYNAIKELKARVSRPASESASRPTSVAQSPNMSGYDPDSPGTTMSFASPTPYPFSPSYESGSPDGREILGHQTHGLGFSDDDAALGRSQARSLSASTASRSLRAKAQPMGAATSGGHKRSTTVDSFSTTNDGTVDEPILEEEEEGLMGPPASKPSPIAIPIRRGQSSKLARSPSIAGSEASSKSSPNASKKPKSERGFFSSTLGRARKPPPRAPEEPAKPNLAENRATRSRMALSSSTGSRRSTRLFNAFSSGSEREKEPARPRTRVMSSTPSAEGPTAMSPKTVGAATAEMTRSQPAAVTNGNLLEKIGSPDYSGWMQKKGEKYSTWKQRFFVLKGVHLYYLKSEGEQKVKGFINLTGYRVLSDPDIHPGEFGFKIIHDVDRAHYFSAAEQATVRNWMKEIMKATIGRDYSTAVVSSCNIETMPLSVAQSMSPRPRPPSPASRARVQKERYAGTNPNTLTPKDALILMEFSGSPLLGNTSPTMGSLAGVASSPAATSPVFPPVTKRESSLSENATPKSPPMASPPMQPLQRAASATSSSPALEYVNTNLPSSVPRVADLGNSLRSGRVLVRLLEKLSGQDSKISDASFAKFVPPSREHAFDPAYFDVIFEVFDFVSPLVSTDEISMDDMLSGNETQLGLLVDRIRTAYPA